MSKVSKFFISNQILDDFVKKLLYEILKKTTCFTIITIQRWDKQGVIKSTDLRVSRTGFSGKRESKGWKG